jgi:hypothetical protein
MQCHHQLEYLFIVYKVFEMSKLDLSADLWIKTVLKPDVGIVIE